MIRILLGQFQPVSAGAPVAGSHAATRSQCWLWRQWFRGRGRTLGSHCWKLGKIPWRYSGPLGCASQCNSKWPLCTCHSLVTVMEAMHKNVLPQRATEIHPLPLARLKTRCKVPAMAPFVNRKGGPIDWWPRLSHKNTPVDGLIVTLTGWLGFVQPTIGIPYFTISIMGWNRVVCIWSKDCSVFEIVPRNCRYLGLFENSIHPKPVKIPWFVQVFLSNSN